MAYDHRQCSDVLSGLDRRSRCLDLCAGHSDNASLQIAGDSGQHAGGRLIGLCAFVT